VKVLDNDVAVERDIQVGIRTVTDQEIVSGLSVGDTIVQ
jgi:hypothetical protein